MKHRTVFSLAVVGLFAGAVSATAQMYNIDANSSTSATYAGAAVLGTASSQWNGLTGNKTQLFSDSGVSSVTASSPNGVTFATTLPSTFNDTGGTTTNPANLMSDYFYNNPIANGASSGTVTLGGLAPNDTFTLVIYSAGDNSAQGAKLTLTGATGGNSASTLTTTGNDRDITKGIGDAYNTFTGTVGSTGTLVVNFATISTSPSGNYVAFNGLQIVEAVPEPSTWASLVAGSGLVMLALLRRHRQMA